LAYDEDRIVAIARNQIVEPQDAYAGHCRERGDRFFVTVGLGKFEQRSFVEIARLLQSQDRAPGLDEIARAFEALGPACDFGDGHLARVLPSRRDDSDQAAAADAERSCHKLLQTRVGNILTLADR